MLSRSMFPRALAVCIGLVTLALPAVQAQEIESLNTATRPRLTNTVVSRTAASAPTLENDIFIVSEAKPTAATHTATFTDIPTFDVPKNFARQFGSSHLDQMLLAAIENRIGTPYVWGASGPTGFDCSGFVWSVFRSANISFERTNARTLWSRFAPASETERGRFGTLVFFKDLTHVGIVADDRGFYHASSSQGVTYSLFDEYWSSRIDGFRVIPAARVMLASSAE